MTKRELGRYRTILSSRLAVLKEHAQIFPARTARSSDRLADKLEIALRKLESGSFGLCETCGGQITPARLDTHPATTFCAGCKRGTRTF